MFVVSVLSSVNFLDQICAKLYRVHLVDHPSLPTPPLPLADTHSTASIDFPGLHEYHLRTPSSFKSFNHA
jgi:hypothetical protein